MDDRGDAKRGAAGAVGPGLTPDGFAARFQESSRMLWCIAAGVTGDRALADDIIQEAAAIALTKLNEFDPGTSFGAWMGRIVRFCALNQARTGQRRRTHASADPGAGVASFDRRTRPAVTAHGEIAPGQSEFDDRVVSALGTLEPPARACLLLRTVVGLNYKEISAAMDLPEGTAMSHVYRARQRMRAALSDDRTQLTEDQTR